MRFRQWMKAFVFGSCPGFRGRFRYFGTKVHFPPGSVVFRMACKQGVFEENNVRVLEKLVRAGSWFFDVGANIGLISVPILRVVQGSHVVSFEPSPGVLPYLDRTRKESGLDDRWHVVPNAVGLAEGRATFFVSTPAHSAFDGLRATGRAAPKGRVEVHVTTLDVEWDRLGRPEVSAIKCDIEGGERDALLGGERLIRAQRPAILIEWNESNLGAYRIPPSDILSVARRFDYRVHALPFMARVETEEELAVLMSSTEDFLLLARR